MLSTISIVTPTFNRLGLVCDSINSSLRLIEDGYACELIVVDDASSDGTYDYLYAKYQSQIQRGLISVIQLEKNLGVSGAKNIGAQHASGDYIAFMDSDDRFSFDAGWLLASEISKLPGVDIFFFRCVDLVNGDLIGPIEPERMVTLSDMVNGYLPGECLPVVRSEVFNALSYPAELRGGEALLYMSVLEGGGALFLSSNVVREYRTGASDQLCNPTFLRGPRAKSLLYYNLRQLKYLSHMTTVNKVRLILKLMLYSYRTAVFNLLKANF